MAENQTHTQSLNVTEKNTVLINEFISFLKIRNKKYVSPIEKINFTIKYAALIAGLRESQIYELTMKRVIEGYRPQEKEKSNFILIHRKDIETMPRDTLTHLGYEIY